ncbi:MAG: UDP-4-amino-4,6-dideoxy-N-acetyl-beta-L-altrosamine transaminase [Bacteriovoracia bacterium]
MTIPYGRQDISSKDIDEVISVLRSDFLTQGPRVPAFEEKVAEFCGAKFGVAANSATSSLHVACLALGLKPGDLVWTSPITFVASSNCALYCGADVDFVDIDPKTFNLCPAKLKEKLMAAAMAGRLPKIVIPVHLAGQSCDMQAIHALSLEYGFKVIEDASHAIGASYLGKPVGDCRFSDITVFSFHPVKIITTAEGGLATTNDPLLADRMRLFRSHGITREHQKMKHASHGDWYYEQLELGYNYRMTELQAALGLSQMDRLVEFVQVRHEIAKTYDRELKDLDLELPYQSPDAYSSLHLYVIKTKAADHSRVFAGLRSAGILANLHYIPVYRHPYYEALGFSRSEFPASEDYYARAISIPIYSGLKPEDQERVISVLRGLVS